MWQQIFLHFEGREKSHLLSYNEYQETSKEHHLYNDKVAINIVLNIIKHE